MKRLIGTTLLIGLLPLVAAAQGKDYSKGHGYVYSGAGATAAFDDGGEGIIHMGAGGEGFFHKHLGIGADLGYVAPFERFTKGVGTFSPNLVARSRGRNHRNRLEPFVTCGYTRFLGLGDPNGANFGGGVNWWFKERLGLRFELRDNLWGEGGEIYHLAGFRLGLTFR